MATLPYDEIKRKSFHLLMLFYIAAYWYLPRELFLKAFAAFIVVVVLGDALRLFIPDFNQWILGFMGGVHRADEVNKPSGLPWTLSGSFLTMFIFPDSKIVLMSLLYLAFGDSFAALIGRCIGKHRLLGEKTVEGSFSCFAICLLLGLLLFPWPVALAGALAATVIELIPWPLNDNFWIPLVSASVLTVLVSVL